MNSLVGTTHVPKFEFEITTNGNLITKNVNYVSMSFMQDFFTENFSSYLREHVPLWKGSFVKNSGSKDMI